MSPIAFDTLAYARHLVEAGVPREQAEAHAEALAAAVMPQLVTKADLERLATKDDLHEVDRRLTTAIAELETRLTVRMGALVVAAIGATAALGQIF